MSQPLDRTLNKAKNEGEELLHRVSGLMTAIEYSDITLDQKRIFANEFSKLVNDVATLNEIILNTITNDNIDLESYVIAPERLGAIEACNSYPRTFS